jgi:hypothetical protein
MVQISSAFWLPWWALSSCLLVLDYSGYEDAAVGGAGAPGGASSSGGAGGDCQPFEEVACYDGPMGTENVGICAAGTMTCAADGASFGPCEGQVTPSPELCADGLDENCDGSRCLGLLWADRFGDAEPGRVTAVALGLGQILVAGAFRGAIDFGTPSPLVRTAPGETTFVASWEATGAANWAVASNDDTQTERPLALIGDEGIYVAGERAPDGEPLRGFVRLHSEATGGVTASMPIEATGDAGATALASVGGALVVAAHYAGDATISAVEVSSHGGSADVLLVERGPGLIPLGGTSVRSFGGPGDDRPTAMIGFASSVAVAGTYQQVITFPEVLVDPLPDAGTSSDAFLILYDVVSDEVLWARGILDPSDDGGVTPLGVAPLDGVVVVGHMNGEVDFGGAMEGPSNGVDAFVARYDVHGTLLWVVRFGGAGDQRATACATDGTHLYVAGTFETVLDFAPDVPGDTIAPGAPSDAWLARMDVDGNLVWMRSYATAGSASMPRLAAQGLLVLGGGHDGKLDFGGPAGALTTQGEDPFVAAFTLP